MTTATTQTLDCGHEPSPHSEHTTGYGVRPDGSKHCWDCCARFEREAMIETGKATLYLVPGGGFERSSVQDWPGGLNFPVAHEARGDHNIAGSRIDVWFMGPDGFVWHGTQYGGNTQLIHCKRTKQTTF